MPLRFATVAVAFAAVAALAGCSDDDDSTTTSSTTAPVDDGAGPEPLAVAEVGTPDPGQARVALGGGFDVLLEVVSCSIDPGAEPEGEVPAELVSVQAEGARADGTPVLLDVKRFRSAGAATTITDTVTVLEGTEEAPARVSVAQRFEVGGQVTDGRDPEADDPLLQVRGSTVRASGVFAPPGAFAGDPAAVAGAVAATCT